MTADDDKLTRLEESIAFGERQSEVLGDEIRKIAETARAFERRLQRLEARLDRLAEAEDGIDSVSEDPATDRPPHSAG